MEQALFGEDPVEKLADLEERRIKNMHRLAEIAEDQKRVQSWIRGIESEMRKTLQRVPEHWIPEDQELAQEDVDAWCSTTYFNLAHTMASNPHAYFSRKKSRHPDMYERVVQFVLDNGYEQRYGADAYTVLDVELNAGKWFIWPMCSDARDSEVLNLKPDSMRPEQK